MRGISPVISFVLLIAIVMISMGALYFWVVGSGSAPAVSQVDTTVQVHKYNTTMLKVTNIGVVNTSAYDSLNTTEGDCDFASSTVLIPGVMYNCSLAAPASGEVRVWADGVNPTSVYL